MMYAEAVRWIEYLTWGQLLPGINAVLVYLSGLFTAYITYRLSRMESNRKERLQEKQDAMQRRNIARMQFDLQCRFFGPIDNKIIIDIVFTAENKGQNLRSIEAIKYRVYGSMGDSDTLKMRQAADKTQRIALTDYKFTTESDWEWPFTIEPGIKQIFPLTAIIDASLKYVLVKVDVKPVVMSPELGESNWYGEERFFPVVIASTGQDARSH